MREANNPNLQKPRPAIPLEIPHEYADSRGRMVHLAVSYYDALDNNTGHLAPFAADCERRENGMRTAPFGGASLVADEKTGLAIGLSRFPHPVTQKQFQRRKQPSLDRPERSSYDRNEVDT